MRLSGSVANAATSYSIHTGTLSMDGCHMVVVEGGTRTSETSFSHDVIAVPMLKHLGTIHTFFFCPFNYAENKQK